MEKNKEHLKIISNYVYFSLKAETRNAKALFFSFVMHSEHSEAKGESVVNSLTDPFLPVLFKEI